jgi:CHASE2 domain-containing sensor protein
MLKAIFDKNNIFCTIFVLAFIYSLTIIPIPSFFEPIDDALEDFELTDLVFSRLSKGTHEEDKDFSVGAFSADTNIVIVNIGKLSREGVAAQLDIIASQKPKIIGIDAFFRKLKPTLADVAKDSTLINSYSPEDTHGDSVMSNTFAKVEQAGTPVVLVSKLSKPNIEKKYFDSLELSNPFFSQYCENAFSNMITDSLAKEYRTSRTFTPFLYYKNNKVNHFAVYLANAYNPTAAQNFLKREKKYEIIKFSGNKDKFSILDVNQVFDPNLNQNIFKNKIVLMGYMGESLDKSDWEDMFYSPLNSRYVGKAYPDIYGIVIHANIISMILSGNHVNTIPDYLSLLIGILICHLTVVIFHHILHKYAIWYGAWSKVIQLVQSLIIVIIILLVFEMYNYKLDLSLAIGAIILAGDLVEIWFDGIMNINWQKWKNLSALGIKKNIRGNN